MLGLNNEVDETNSARKVGISRTFMISLVVHSFGF